MTAERGGNDAVGAHGTLLTRLARAGVAVIVVGFFVFFLGIFPQVVRLDITPGIGIFQIFVALIGISIMTAGAYVYIYATRHRAQPRRIREDIGLRLVATGLVFAWTSGLADVLGIGSHPATPVTRPFFGVWQATGVAIGVGVIIIGLLLYAPRGRE